MKHITKIKEIIEETVIVKKGNEVKEILVDIRYNEKVFVDYYGLGKFEKTKFINEEQRDEYLKKIDADNRERRSDIFNEIKPLFIPDKNGYVNDTLFLTLTDRQVLDLYIERVKAGRIKGDFVKGEQ